MRILEPRSPGAWVFHKFVHAPGERGYLKIN